MREKPPQDSEGALFPDFWQAFVMGGVPVDDWEKAQCKRIFEQYPREEQLQIGRWVCKQLLTVWRTPEYTARPLNALRSQGWRRLTAERTVPHTKSMSYGERGIVALRE